MCNAGVSFSQLNIMWSRSACLCPGLVCMFRRRRPAQRLGPAKAVYQESDLHQSMLETIRAQAKKLICTGGYCDLRSLYSVESFSCARTLCGDAHSRVQRRRRAEGVGRLQGLHVLDEAHNCWPDIHRLICTTHCAVMSSWWHSPCWAL